MKKIKGTLMIFFVVAYGCGPKEMNQKKLEGINGDAIYIFDNNGAIKGLFKPEYNVHDYAVLLVKDTIELGQDFVSSIYVTNSKHKIIIASPTQEVIQSEGDKVNDSKGYSYKTEKEGVYDFRGTIEYDTTVAPFEYKFIVVKNN